LFTLNLHLRTAYKDCRRRSVSFMVDGRHNIHCVWHMQDAENNWHFDIFGFAEATQGQTLSMMAFYLMKRAGATAKFGMHEDSLCNYLQALEKGYNPLPYHNA